MTRQTATLNELVEALNDGIAFFGLAAERSLDPFQFQALQQIRHAKENIVADLRAVVASDGDASTDQGSWLGAFRRAYADLRSRLATDTQASYIAALEEQEDRILQAFRDATEAEQSNRVREIAASYLPEIQEMHDTLRALKTRLGE